MKVIEASVHFMEPLDGKAIMRHLEACGRVCYKSEDLIGDETADAFLDRVIKRGHESVIEHKHITVKFICDRGVSHEIVRHRIASYSQESTRYCNYVKDKFGNEITVIEPCFWLTPDKLMAHNIWYYACEAAEKDYFALIKAGATPQEARTVLPNSLKTEVIMTTNFREWRHFLRLRCSKAAHPQMREVALKLLKLFHDAVPVLFDDLWELYKDEIKEG